MMKEWNTSDKKHGEPGSLEDRLSAYYGSELPVQPLSSASWVRLQSRLSPQQSFRGRFLRSFRVSRRRIRFMHHPRFSYDGTIPVSIQDAFEYIAQEARLPCTSEILHCTFKGQVRLPFVRVSYWGKRKIHVCLPALPFHPLEPIELNVLLASGLATHALLFERKVPFGLVRMCIMWVCLLALIALCAVGWHHFDVTVFPIATILIAILLCTVALSHRQGRSLAFRVDALMVQWLGRDQVCQGLHALVRRSQHPRRKGFGQISFAERIERVCGTRIAAQSEHLTLVG